jgi:hypothetical protein
MKAKRLLGALLTVGLSLAAAAQATDVQAKPKAEAAPTEPPVVKKAISLPLNTMIWGISPAQVADRIDKILDDDYKPKYKDVQPGIKMKELDAQIAEEKASFRRSRVDFGKTPTGLDATPLKGEYTYNNKEALYTLDRNGTRTLFFFIQERLWKIIEEKQLSEGHSLGKTYNEAVVKMSTLFGVPGRVIATGSTSGATEVDWKDSNSHLRAIQRGETALGLGYEDNGTLAQLATLRANKPPADNGIDPDVAAAIRGAPADPPKDKDKDKKPKK